MTMITKASEKQKQCAVEALPTPIIPPPSFFIPEGQPTLLIPLCCAWFKEKGKAHVKEQQASPPLTKMPKSTTWICELTAPQYASHVSAFSKPAVQTHQINKLSPKNADHPLPKCNPIPHLI